jgi:hypothetical protein
MEQQLLIEENLHDMLISTLVNLSKSSISFKLNFGGSMRLRCLLTLPLFTSSDVEMIFPDSHGICGMFIVFLKHPVRTKDCRASDLGVESWYAEDLGNLMVVPLECFTGHLILAPITVRERDIWITVPYDHVSIWVLGLSLSALICGFQEKAEVDLDEVE